MLKRGSDFFPGSSKTQHFTSEVNNKRTERKELKTDLKAQLSLSLQRKNELKEQNEEKKRSHHEDDDEN